MAVNLTSFAKSAVGGRGASAKGGAEMKTNDKKSGGAEMKILFEVGGAEMK